MNIKHLLTMLMLVVFQLQGARLGAAVYVVQ